jgi:inosine/xanthosine triphosphatase
VYQHTQVKSTTGAVGVLTEGVIDRVQLYEHAVVLALVPFKHAVRHRDMQL